MNKSDTTPEAPQPEAPAPAPQPKAPAPQPTLTFDAPGIYLVQISVAGAKAGAVLKIPAAGSYPVDLAVSRR